MFDWKTLSRLGLLCLLGAGSPTGAAKAGSTVLSSSEAVADCVKSREKALECKAQFVDQMVEMQLRCHYANVPDQDIVRTDLRSLLLPQVEKEAAEPREARKERCKATVDRMKRFPRADADQLEKCYAKADCVARVSCMMPVLERMMFPPTEKPATRR